jgi:hypothetical protein
VLLGGLLNNSHAQSDSFYGRGLIDLVENCLYTKAVQSSNTLSHPRIGDRESGLLERAVLYDFLDFRALLSTWL